MKVLAYLMLALAFVLTSSIVMAQEDPSAPKPGDESLELTELVFDDAYVVSVPANWRFWRASDYEVEAKAVKAFGDLLRQFNPAYDEVPNINNLRLAAYHNGVLENDAIPRMAVVMLPLSQIQTSLGMDFSPSDTVTLIEYGLVGELEINGRQAAAGVIRYIDPQTGEDLAVELLMITFFPEEDILSLFTMLVPIEYLAEHAEVLNTIMVSVRLEDESLDFKALEFFQRGSDRPRPNTPSSVS